MVLASMYMDKDKLVAAMRGNGALSWGEHHACLFHGTERFFRAGYNANLLSSWLPALDGVVDKLKRGGKVADVGCGHGASTLLMAKAFPQSQFIGYDYHAASIDVARERAATQGVKNATFEAADAVGYTDKDFDVIAFFDCLHDMGDPVGAARQAHAALKPGGTVLLVEPFANDSLEQNLNPVGRLFYAASTCVCTPNSLSQEVGLGLGAQAAEATATTFSWRRDLAISVVPPRRPSIWCSRLASDVALTAGGTFPRRPAERALATPSRHWRLSNSASNSGRSPMAAPGRRGSSASRKFRHHRAAAGARRNPLASPAVSSASFPPSPVLHGAVHARVSIVRRDPDFTRARPADAAVGSGGRCGIPPAANDDIARRCDAFAASSSDSQYSGPRAELNDVSLGEALRVCAQAAEARPVRPRYEFLYGSMLLPGGTLRGSGPAVHRGASSRQCLGRAGSGRD